MKLSGIVNRTPPLVLAALAIALLCAMDGLLKELTQHYSSLQVTFMRFAASAAYGVTLFIAWRTAWPDRQGLVGNALRGLLFLVASAFFIHAMGKAPLAQVFAISYMAPILAALLAIPMLGERPGGQVALALALGFIGVLVAIGGVELGGTSWGHLEGAAAAVASSITYAFVLIFLRQRALSDPPITIAMFQSLVPALILGFVFLIYNSIGGESNALLIWKPIRQSDVAALFAIGALSIAGHLALAHAFARDEASRLAPIEYTSFVWAALIGLIWFDEIPTPLTVIGAAMIIGACFLLRRKSA